MKSPWACCGSGSETYQLWRVNLRDIMKEEFKELSDVRLIEETQRQKLRVELNKVSALGIGKMEIQSTKLKNTLVWWGY